MNNTRPNVKSNKALITICAVLSIALSGAAFIIIRNGNTQEQVLGEQDYAQEDTQQTEQKLEDKEKTIYVCDGDICTVVYSDAFKGMYFDNVLVEESINKYVQSKIKPYFDSLYLAKEKVKNQYGEFWMRTTDMLPDYSTLYDDFTEAMVSNDDPYTINLTKIESASTDGTYATKYMEVDLSQQKLYVWNDGEIVRTMKISGAIEKYQVTGVFTIFTKSKLPVSAEGEYMPYWMAFYYNSAEKVSYGIHGLTWQYDDAGNIIKELESNIGETVSEGCIRVLEEDAKYLYENFEIGDYLLIHD